jgi:hypothetical protein
MKCANNFSINKILFLKLYYIVMFLNVKLYYIVMFLNVVMLVMKYILIFILFKT